MKSLYAIPAILVALTLSACGSYGVQEETAGTAPVVVQGGHELTPEPDTTTSAISSETSVPSPVELGETPVALADPAPLPPALVSPPQSTSPLAAYELSRTVVYFEYDSTVVNEDGRAIIVQFAKYLAAHPAAKLRVEGHTDERGTREYNVSLGERRAQSVQSLLIAAGVNRAQLLVTSYGEERPVATGLSEAAMAKNRRVELVR